MPARARNVEEPFPDSAPRLLAGEEISSEDGDELEHAIAEAHEDLRAGRCMTFDEMRAKLRSA